MKNVVTALFRSILDLFRPKIFILFLIPVLLPVLLWTALTAFYWTELSQMSLRLATWMLGFLPEWLGATTAVSPDSMGITFLVVVMALTVLPVIILTVMILASLLIQPVVLRFMKAQYPMVKPQGAGFTIQVASHLVRTGAIFLGLTFLTLPLLLVPFLNLAIPILLAAFLNFRLFLFDALADIATTEEMNLLLVNKKVDFFLMGVLTALLIYFPISFLFAPVISSLAFTRLAFIELQALRTSKEKA